MVELDAPELTSVFHALGDATRRRMLRELAARRATVGQLAQPFAISLAAASKHIKVLESAGLIRREVRGRTHLCRLDPGPLATAQEWLSFYERFWTAASGCARPAPPRGGRTPIPPSLKTETTSERTRELDAYGVLTEPATLTIQRFLPGPIERVWGYLTRSDLRRQWLAAGEMEMKVGAPFELVWRNSELTNPPGKRPEGFGDEHRMESQDHRARPAPQARFHLGKGKTATFRSRSSRGARRCS